MRGCVVWIIWGYFGASWGIDCGATTGSSVRGGCWWSMWARRVSQLDECQKRPCALGSPARSRKTDPANSMWQQHQLPLTRSFTYRFLLHFLGKHFFSTPRDCSHVSPTCAIIMYYSDSQRHMILAFTMVAPSDSRRNAIVRHNPHPGS